MEVRKQSGTAWLLLTFTLPTKRASQRVEVWRKLQRYGTVPLGNSGYLLPSNAVNEERFQWQATAIRKLDEFSALPLQKRAVGRLSRLRSRFQEIVEVDFFDSPLQKRAGELLAKADAARVTTRMSETPKIDPQDYKSKVWVTRPRPGVDRSASAWLIRRFIDSKARFAFAPEEKVPHASVPFDMFHERGFGHRGDDCTFETLQKEFRIRDRRVKIISEVIHDADLADGKFGRKEGYGIDEVLKGWARQGTPDQELLDRGMQLIEGLYHSLV